MNGLKRICNWIETSVNHLLVLTAVVMVIVGVMQIMFRYVFSASLSWSEELMRYLHVWVTTIGGALCFYSGTFTVITIISDKIEAVSHIASKWLTVLRYVLALAFYSLLFWYGIRTCISYAGNLSPAMRISTAAVYLCIPISGFLGILFSVVKFPDLMTALSGRDKK